MKLFKLSKIEKLKLTAMSIKAATGIIGGSMILTESKPYLTLGVLAIGAIANEIVIFIKEKEDGSNSI